MVLLILAIMWAAVLIPPMIRDRRSVGRSRDSVSAFKSQLNVLGQSTPGAKTTVGNRGLRLSVPATPAIAVDGGSSSMPRNSHEAERRRRDIIGVLGAAAFVTFVAALLLGSPAVWMFHVAIDVALLGFIGLVVNHRRTAVERDQNVHYLHPRLVTEEDQSLVQQAR